MSKRQMGCLLAILLACMAAVDAAAGPPQTVRFASADGKTELVGFVWTPSTAGPHPAVVLLHGRSGPYSALARGTYTAESLAERHRMWAEFWASRGYLALHVDSFGPRGYPGGFARGSYHERPSEVSEQFVRPLDAYGALAYLRTRGDVIAARIGVHGWSNGAMAVLAALAVPQSGPGAAGSSAGFRAALAQYPSCRFQAYDPAYRPYAPLLLLVAGADGEVSPETCRHLAERLRQRGTTIEFVLYEGAHHAYDNPGTRRQSHPPNRVALEDSLRRAEAFFARYLASGEPPTQAR